MKVLFWMFIGFDKHETSEHLLTAVIEQLCKAGHTVHILQKHTGGDLPSIPENLASYPITTDAVPFEAVAKGNFVARYLAELRYIRKCKKFINKDFDAVFIQSTTVGGFAVKAVRKKLPEAMVTFNVQDIFPYNIMYCGKMKKRSLQFRILATIQRYGYKHSDQIITISEDMKETLVEDGTAPDKIEVIYNWSYQDEMFENVDLSPVSHMFNKDCFNVVYAGNIGVMQNVDILVETARRMKSDETIQFHIIGNGVYKKTLEDRAVKYGLQNITFWPIQSPELAPAIYCSASVNVIPLVKNVYRTALPSKTATCLACKKPIIFAIGKDSIFGAKISLETECQLIDSDDTEALVGIIQKKPQNTLTPNTGRFYERYCKASENSAKYANIITGSY